MNKKKGKRHRKGEFEKVLSQYKAIYDSFGKIACPALNGAEVRFNRTGWDHISGRKWKSERERIERMKLLPLAKKLIGMTTTIQSIRYYEGFKTFEFNAWMDGVKVTAIVSRTKNGFVFLSNFKDNDER